MQLNIVVAVFRYLSRIIVTGVIFVAAYELIAMIIEIAADTKEYLVLRNRTIMSPRV